MFNQLTLIRFNIQLQACLNNGSAQPATTTLEFGQDARERAPIQRQLPRGHKTSLSWTTNQEVRAGCRNSRLDWTGQKVPQLDWVTPHCPPFCPVFGSEPNQVPFGFEGLTMALL